MEYRLNWNEPIINYAKRLIAHGSLYLQAEGDSL